ncbi:hypothetical protein B0H16DRAFT_1467069 [Mycena metata]|uniref:Uncharacterized protein n=1 Tax=Mycena metata TaxID=1033252 RepID=A0AAD7I7S9_9AGAR|nr:hypothetical protein B0H16DRAFT_1467069 [Mycena metata]
MSFDFLAAARAAAARTGQSPYAPPSSSLPSSSTTGAFSSTVAFSSTAQSSTSIPATLPTPAPIAGSASTAVPSTHPYGPSLVPAVPIFQPAIRYTSLFNPASSSAIASSSKSADAIYVPYVPNSTKPVKKKANMKKNKGKSNENDMASMNSGQKRKVANSSQIESEPRQKRVKLVPQTDEAAAVISDEDEDVVVKKKPGPARHTEEQRLAKAEELLKTRRELRAGKPKTGLKLSDDNKQMAVDYLAQELRSLYMQQQEIAAAITNATTDSTSIITAVDAVLQAEQQLAPAPIPVLDIHFLEFLDAYAQDPLHLNVDNWVESGVLVEDVGEIEPDGTARSYIRVAELASDHVLGIMTGKMYSRPADIPWIALVLCAHGIPQDQVLQAVKSAVEYYGLDFGALQDPIRLLFTSPHPSNPSPLTLTNPGITIENSPLARLQQELAAKAHSRFHHMSQHLTWKAYHLPAADISAPGGALDFRRDPAIGRREALTVNAGRGLILNTTPGGTWIPSFRPCDVIWDVVSAARLPLQTVAPNGLSPEIVLRLTTFLKQEWKFWCERVGKSKTCVRTALSSITANVVDAAWTVNTSTVMVTVAEDITEEERSGKIGGIEEETAGPAIKEFMHIVRMLHPHDGRLQSPEQMRQMRGPFLNLYRVQEAVDRATHLALFSRYLSFLAPTLIHCWSSTMNCCFRLREPELLFREAAHTDITEFFEGRTDDPSKIVPNHWYADGRLSPKDDYVKAIGVPCIVQYSPEPGALAILLGDSQLGGAKHDPKTANYRRKIFFVTYGGVVIPAMAIIERDLLDNGPLDRTDAASLEIRLERLCHEIYDHAEKHGVYTLLNKLKEEYLTLQRSLVLLRSLQHRNVKASPIDDDGHSSASCPGEGDSDEEDEEEEEESGEDEEVVRRRPRLGYVEVAAIGKVARQAQLEHLIQEANEAERRGLPVDPRGYVPYNMTITSPEFKAKFMALDDGKDLAQWGRSWGRTPASNQAAVDGHQRLGKWRRADAIERRSLLEAKAEDLDLSPDTVHERANRSIQLAGFLKSSQDPRNAKNRILLESMRAGRCQRCRQVVVGSSRATKHFCENDPDNPLCLTESDFPSLRRLIHCHDVLNDADLHPLVNDQPTLVSRTVADILTPALLQAALPLDYTHYEPKMCSKLVYLPPALKDDLDLWITLAVDVLLAEQDQCPDACKPTTAAQRNIPWVDGRADALTAWAKPRMTGTEDASGDAVGMDECDPEDDGVWENGRIIPRPYENEKKRKFPNWDIGGESPNLVERWIRNLSASCMGEYYRVLRLRFCKLLEAKSATVTVAQNIAPENCETVDGGSGGNCSEETEGGSGGSIVGLPTSTSTSLPVVPARITPAFSLITLLALTPPFAPPFAREYDQLESASPGRVGNSGGDGRRGVGRVGVGARLSAGYKRAGVLKRVGWGGAGRVWPSRSKARAFALPVGGGSGGGGEGGSTAYCSKETDEAEGYHSESEWWARAAARVSNCPCRPRTPARSVWRAAYPSQTECCPCRSARAQCCTGIVGNKIKEVDKGDARSCNLTPTIHWSLEAVDGGRDDSESEQGDDQIGVPEGSGDGADGASATSGCGCVRGLRIKESSMEGGRKQDGIQRSTPGRKGMGSAVVLCAKKRGKDVRKAAKSRIGTESWPSLRKSAKTKHKSLGNKVPKKVKQRTDRRGGDEIRKDTIPWNRARKTQHFTNLAPQAQSPKSLVVARAVVSQRRRYGRQGGRPRGGFHELSPECQRSDLNALFLPMEYFVTLAVVLLDLTSLVAQKICRRSRKNSVVEYYLLSSPSRNRKASFAVTINKSRLLLLNHDANNREDWMKKTSVDSRVAGRPWFAGWLSAGVSLRNASEPAIWLVVPRRWMSVLDVLGCKMDYMAKGCSSSDGAGSSALRSPFFLHTLFNVALICIALVCNQRVFLIRDISIIHNVGSKSCVLVTRAPVHIPRAPIFCCATVKPSLWLYVSDSFHPPNTRSYSVVLVDAWILFAGCIIGGRVLVDSSAAVNASIWAQLGSCCAQLPACNQIHVIINRILFKVCRCNLRPNSTKAVKKKVNAKKNKGKSNENEGASMNSGKKRKAVKDAQIESETSRQKRVKLVPQTDEPAAVITSEDVDVDDVVVKKKPGPARHTEEQRLAKAEELLENRRELRAGKPKMGLKLSDENKQLAVNYLAQELHSLCMQQQEIATAITNATTDSTSIITAVDAVLRELQQLAPAPIPVLDFDFLEFLDAYAQDPLHLKVDNWVESGVLVEDVGEIEPDGTARSYIRVAELASDHVLGTMTGKMYSRPADIPWIALVLCVHGIPQDQVLQAVKSAVEYYGLDFGALQDPIRLLFTSPHPSNPSPLTLTNPGITIENTPLLRLQQELTTKGHSRFHHMSKHLTWKAYHLPAADISAPGGALDFRRNPAIGRCEALTVNAGRGLVLNTTPGGTWIPSFRPCADMWDVVSAARLPLQTVAPAGLSPEIVLRLKTFLKKEWDFWREQVGTSTTCVRRALRSITANVVDAAWTVNGSTVMVTVAEDITEEQRVGKIGGIEEETAGPAMKEYMHTVRMLHPNDGHLQSPEQMRQMRGPFLDLFRMQEPVDRSTHLALFCRHLSALAPTLIHSWSSTMSHCFRYREPELLFREATDADVTEFFEGRTDDPSKIVPNRWYSDGRLSPKGDYVKAIGVPCIVQYSPEPGALAILLGNFHLGGAKHDPKTANRRRQIFFVTYGGIVIPAMAIIECDLLENGPLDRTDVTGLKIRLERLCHEIYDHAEKHGVYTLLNKLKEEYLTLQQSLVLLRSLQHRNVKASPVDDDGHSSASCPGEGDSDEDEEDEATEEESGEDEEVVRRRPRLGYVEVAATGKVARQAQLERLIQEANEAERRGLPVDPRGYVPYDMTITSPEFKAKFMALDDGKDLAQWGRSWGRTPASNQAAVEGHQRLGKWRRADAIERRSLLEAKAEDLDLSPDTVHERANRSIQIAGFLKSSQDPRNAKNRILLESMRAGRCQRCRQVVVGSSRATKHFCAKDPDNPLSLTESDFPSLRRLIHCHDVLNNADLHPLVTDQPTLVSRTVADILTPALLQAALPLDYTHYEPKTCSKLVYLPPALKDDLDLWITLAVDVLLAEQDQCPDACKPTTAAQRNIPWVDGRADALTAWAKPRMTGTEGKPLFITRCQWGWMSVIPKMTVYGKTGESYHVHVCDETRRREKNGETRSNAFDGTRNCRTCQWKAIDSMADLPSDFSRYFWLSHRIFNAPSSN